MKLLYVKFVCVKLLYVEAGGRREEEEEPGIQNQKQEPHTKLWGKSIFVQPPKKNKHVSSFLSTEVVFSFCSSEFRGGPFHDAREDRRHNLAGLRSVLKNWEHAINHTGWGPQDSVQLPYKWRNNYGLW